MCLSDFNYLHSSPQVAEPHRGLSSSWNLSPETYRDSARVFCFTMIQKKTYKFDKSHKTVENNRESHRGGKQRGTTCNPSAQLVGDGAMPPSRGRNGTCADYRDAF